MRHTRSRIRGGQRKPGKEQLEQSGEAHRRKHFKKRKHSYLDNSKEPRVKIEREKKERKKVEEALCYVG